MKFHFRPGREARRRFVTIVIAASLCLGLTLSMGCSAKYWWPKSFTRTAVSDWIAIPINPNLSYDDSWEEVLDVMAQKFELEMISKEGGYIRTAWMHNWWKEGRFTEKYRVRAILKFSPDKSHVRIKTDAQYLLGEEWILGNDQKLLQTIRTEVLSSLRR